MELTNHVVWAIKTVKFWPSVSHGPFEPSELLSATTDKTLQHHRQYLETSKRGIEADYTRNS